MEALLFQPDGLKRCPFCGRADTPALFTAEELENGGDDMYTVCCDMNAGGCGASGGYRENGTEAIMAWNTRSLNKPTMGTTPIDPPCQTC